MRGGAGARPKSGSFAAVAFFYGINFARRARRVRRALANLADALREVHAVVRGAVRRAQRRLRGRVRRLFWSWRLS